MSNKNCVTIYKYYLQFPVIDNSTNIQKVQMVIEKKGTIRIKSREYRFPSAQFYTACYDQSATNNKLDTRNLAKHIYQTNKIYYWFLIFNILFQNGCIRANQSIILAFSAVYLQPI